MIGKIRTCSALLLVASATLALAPLQYSALKLGFPRRTLVPVLWHRMVMKALGFRVRVKGEMSAERPLFIVANHVSWTDIMVVGSVAEVAFVAKSELAGWPFVGWLARMQRTVFVERDRRRKSGEQASEIGRRLAHGEAVVLFAEGSTSDGNTILPFKSTLFGAAKMAIDEGSTDRVVIQPLAIAYTRFHGMPMQRVHMPVATWIGDRELLPHIKTLLKEGAIDVELRFGEPFEFTAATNRKAISGEAERQVRELHRGALRDPS